MIKYNYIKLTADKAPKHSLDKVFCREDVADEDFVAVMVNEPYVVLDIDNEDYFNVLLEIVKDKKIRTRVLKTDRGGHFWFKSSTPLTNHVDINTPITIRTDIKSWGKKSMVTVKKNGTWRNWLIEDENVDELPFWLTPIKSNKELFDLKEGDGRDPELFSYIIPLINLKFTKEQIHEIFDIINQYVFSDPLKEEEIDKMFDNNDIFDKKELCFFYGKNFLHNVFVDWMMETHFFRSYGNRLYVYKDGIYQQNDDEIFRKMIEQIPTLKQNNLREAYENLRLKVTSKNDQIDPMIVNLKNGLYDLRNGEFIEHTPYIFNVNQLNCSYDKDAYCHDVDKMLNDISTDNPAIRELLEAILGYLLIGDCRYQVAFILLGHGANGKSKFLEMVMNWLGDENCSSLALEDLSERFRTSQLVGKVANIGDDSGADLLKNTAIFKKLVTGDSITVEFKNKQPFPFSNRSKLLFSANSLPPSSDKSDGFFRRIIIVPFRAVFKPGMKNYDPNLGDKLCTEKAKSYLLNLAIKSAEKMIKDNGIIIPEEIKNLTGAYEIENNNVLQWLTTSLPILEGKVVQSTYTEYCMFCGQNNTFPVAMVKFIKEISRKYPEISATQVEENGICVCKWKKTS